MSRGPGGSIWTVVAGNAGMKVAVMGFSGALAFLTTHLMITRFGVGAYAQFGLLATMGALLPFADLGLSAAVMNGIAESPDPRRDPRVQAVLTSALRLLLLSALALAAAAGAATAFGLWPVLLGQGLLAHGGSAAALGCGLVFALTLPLGVGQRILTGLHRNQLQVGLQALAAPFLLAGVGLLVLAGRGGWFLPVLSYLASAVVALACVLLAARVLGPALGRAVADVPRLRAVNGVPVMGVAGPMLAQMLALPVALQTDRLLLSHLAGTAELAQYNLGAQLFGLVVQTINSAGIALWPVFAAARARGQLRSPLPAAAAFTGGGLALALALAAILPWVTPVLTDGRVRLDGWVVAGFVLFVAGQAAKYPLGMYMTDRAGLRFQVAPILVMVPVNLGLSWVATLALGAAGPILGSGVCVLACQVLPNLWYVRRDLARRAAAGQDRPAGVASVAHR